MLDLIEHRNIIELRLARPPVNALDHALIRKLVATIPDVIDQGADGLILSGRPGVFSAGLDIPSIIDLDHDSLLEYWVDFYRLFKSIAVSPVPVGAAVTGHSPAGGTVMAIFCDWRVAARGQFLIGLNEVQVGLALPEILFHAYSLVIGPRNAERLGVLGALVDPGQALACGMVDELCEAEKVVARSLERMEEMLSLPRAAMLNTRKTARKAMIDLFDRFGSSTMDQMVEFWYRPETQAALRRFLATLKSGR